MKMLIAALTLGALVATPVSAGTGKFASSRDNHAHARKAAHDAFARVAPRTTSPQTAYGAITPFVGAAREAALHDCSIKSRQYTETTWGDMQVYQFRACMTQYGQPE